MPAILRYTLLIVTAGLLGLTIYRSWTVTQQTGGTDLRCRTIASRLLTTNHSPYFYKWNPSDGEYYLNPNDVATRVVNGNVVTPAMLYTVYPASALPYSIVRPLWTILQFLICFAALFLLLYKQTRSQATVAGVVVIAGLVCSNTWLFGIERGQVYIFYVLFFALMYRLYISDSRYNEFLSGLAGGLFVFFRPFAGIIALVFLLQGKKKWLAGWVAGLVLGTCWFVLPDISSWKDYFNAMQEYTYESMGQGHGNPGAIDPAKPEVIEGMNTLRLYRNFPAGKISGLYGYLRAELGIWINNKQSLAAYAGIVVLFFLFFLRIKKKVINPEALFLLGFVLYILAELFTIAPRGAYSVIQWIFPLTLILLRVRPGTPLFIAPIGALLLLHLFPFKRFDYQGEIAELILLGVSSFFIFFPRSIKKWQYGTGRI
jgi:hypothetical protein